MAGEPPPPSYDDATRGRDADRTRNSPFVLDDGDASDEILEVARIPADESGSTGKIKIKKERITPDTARRVAAQELAQAGPSREKRPESIGANKVSNLCYGATPSINLLIVCLIIICRFIPVALSCEL